MRGSDAVRFIGRRLVQLVGQVLLISVIIFALLYISPGSVEQILLGDQPMTAESVRAIRERYHLDEPLPVQYAIWLWDALHLDFGRSIRTNELVVDSLMRRLPVTLALVAYGFVLTMAAGIMLGAVSALRKATMADRTIVALSVVGISSPAFVTGLVLLYAFAILLPLFPVFGQGDTLLKQIWHLTLPSIALALTSTAMVIKLTRAAMIEAMGKDYVSFARARGLPRSKVLFGYVMRNSLTAIATAGGLIFNRLLFATVLVEVTFALPGLGSLLIDSVGFKDMPMVQGLGLLFALLIITVTIVVDLLYVVIDPRIRFSRVAA